MLADANSKLMNVNSNVPDRSNVQGLILRGYTHPFSCHLLFSFPTSISKQKAFFNAIYSKVQSAKDWGNNKPVSMLNIGFTFNGIAQLDPTVIRPQDLANFPATFQQGPTSGGSQSSLADVCDPASTPEKWWNGQGDAVNTNLHCVVHIYALTTKDLDALVTTVLTAATKNGLQELIPLAPTVNKGRLYQSIVENDVNKIHFGYTDGISEPSLANPTNVPDPQTINNFVIGYPDGAVTQPGPAGDGTTASTFAKDGCYNAFRIIYQNAAAFNSFLKQQAANAASTLAYLNLTQPQLEEWFAAKLCGRWRNGSPLMLSPDKPDPATSASEDFGYATQSQQGAASSANDVASSLRCPFSAHTRVANPRDQTLSSSEGKYVPRIARRGMPYGAALPNASTIDDGVDRGLIGIFLCGDLAGQFEKLYGWMNNNNFSDKTIFSVKHPPQDALLGNRKAANSSYFPGSVTSFTIPIEGGTKPIDGANIKIDALPEFLTTRGTAYCLLPSLSTLATLAGLTK